MAVGSIRATGPGAQFAEAASEKPPWRRPTFVGHAQCGLLENADDLFFGEFALL